jgi:hypothetical protein
MTLRNAWTRFGSCVETERLVVRHLTSYWLAVTVACCSLAAGSTARAQQKATAIELVRVATLGDSETEVRFGRVAAATFAAGDRLVIADGAFNSISSFDPNGRWIATVGRDGSGPLEFSALEWIGACGPNELIAFDLMTRRFTVLGPDLSYRSAFRVAGAPTGMTCTSTGHLAFLELAHDLEPTNAREWYSRARLRLMRSTETSPLFVDTVALGDLVKVNGAWMIHPGGRRTTLVSVRSGIGVAPGGANPIVVYDTLGRRISSIPVRVSARTMTDTEQQSVADEFMSRLPDLAARESMVRTLLGTRRDPVAVGYRRAVAGVNGVIWLQTSFRGGSRIEIELVDTTGQRIAALALSGDGELLAVGRSRVAILRSTPDGAHVIELFAVKGS